MANKKFDARIVQKIDSSENWEKATGFIPLPGEFFLVKDIPCPIVIGDGVTSAAELCKAPLFTPISNEKIDALFEGGGVE